MVILRLIYKKQFPLCFTRNIPAVGWVLRPNARPAARSARMIDMVWFCWVAAFRALVWYGAVWTAHTPHARFNVIFLSIIFRQLSSIKSGELSSNKRGQGSYSNKKLKPEMNAFHCYTFLSASTHAVHTIPWVCYRRRNQWLRLALALFCLPLMWLARVVYLFVWRC